MTDRYRSQNSSSPTPGYSWEWKTYPKGGGPAIITSSGSHTPGQTGQWVGTKKSMTDVVTPGFVKLKAAGNIISSPMYKTSETRSGVGGDFNLSYTPPGGDSYTGKSTGGFGNGLSWPTPTFGIDISNVVTVATTKCLAGVEQPDAYELVAAAELRKTIHMLKHPLEGLHEFILSSGSRAMRSRKMRYRLSRLTADDALRYAKLRDYEKLVVSSWLAARFGWRPFIYDLMGAYKAISENPSAITRERKTTRSSSVDSSSDQISLANGTNTWASPSFIITNGVEIFQETVSVRATLLYEHTLQLSKALGIHPQTIPSTVWELIPFSFVSDWVVNAGDFLAAVTPKLGVNELMGCYVIDRTSYRTRNVSEIRFPGWNNTTSSVGESKTTMVRTTQRVPGLPAPSIALIPQGVQNVLSDWRTLDVITLISALKSGGLRSFMSTRI